MDSLIPKPLSLVKKDCSFLLLPETKIVATSPDALPPAELLAEYLRTATAYPLEVVSREEPGKNSIVLRSLGKDEADKFDLVSEKYSLIVEEKGVFLTGDNSMALFRGIQTLRQLFPKEIYSPCAVKDIQWELPGVVIEDQPLLRWRGMMLDVARHFFPKEQLFRMIELFAQHKFNRIHLHLTDDQGWRVEIKKYPRLTEVGSVRKQTIIGHDWDRPRKYDTTPYGGFYTQDELREVVAFAARRGIEVIPEIDMPGHCASAICAYPELGTFPQNHVPVRENWGVGYHLLSPRDSVIEFLKDVFTEIMTIFPSRLIHIGGDEARKDEWEISPEVQQLMWDHNCKSEKEMQGYMTNEIRKFFRQHNRLLYGWEEILDDSMGEESLIVSWRAKDNEIKAARQHCYAIVANRKFAYLDYMQADRAYEELPFGEYLPADIVYQFRPMPPGLTPEEQKYILGGQGQLWSEYIASSERLEYMAFPRSCALAEKLWTPEKLCRYRDFLDRLALHREKLDIQEVKSCPLP